MLPEPIALFETKYRNSDTPLADYEVAKSYGGYYDGMFPPVVFTKFPFQPTNETLQEGYAMLVEAREHRVALLKRLIGRLERELREHNGRKHPVIVTTVRLRDLVVREGRVGVAVLRFKQRDGFWQH